MTNFPSLNKHLETSMPINIFSNTNARKTNHKISVTAYSIKFVQSINMHVL